MGGLLSRLEWEGWTALAAGVAFFITFSLFLFQVWRVLRMKKEKREHAANLPLADENAPVRPRGRI